MPWVLAKSSSENEMLRAIGHILVFDTEDDALAHLSRRPVLAGKWFPRKLTARDYDRPTVRRWLPRQVGMLEIPVEDVASQP